MNNDLNKLMSAFAMMLAAIACIIILLLAIVGGGILVWKVAERMLDWSF